jgi:acyl carrier protein
MNLDIENFIKQVEEIFDEEIKPGTLTPKSVLEKQVDITSVNALILMSMVKIEYNVVLEEKELKKCKTIDDLHKIILKKTK